MSSVPECVCGEINTRHCPVHGQDSKPSSERARALWSQADSLREKGERLKYEGEALCRAAERMNALAAAIADGREADIREIALSMAGQP